MANVLGNPFMVYTYWSKVYHLVFDDLTQIIENKLNYAEGLNDWLGKNDFATSEDSKKYGHKLKALQSVTNEIDILLAVQNLFPTIKCAYDRYLSFMSDYHDSEKEFLKMEVNTLRTKIKHYEQNKNND
jgi:hypothetical protein